MTLKEFLSRLNLKIIVLHATATIFFIASARQFSVLNDVELVENMANYGSDVDKFVNHFNSTELTMHRFSNFSILKSFFQLIALTISCLVSLLIFVKRKLQWYNILPVFLLVIIILRLGFFSLSSVIYGMNVFAYKLFDLNLENTYILNGILLLIIGSIVFIFTIKNHFLHIEHHQKML